MRPNAMHLNPTRAIVAGLTLVTGMFCAAASAHAQLNGENLLGDMGVKSGTQPDPGLYVSNIYYRYGTDSIKDARGNPVQLDPTGNGSQTINAAVPLVYYVTPMKVLGAHIGMMAVLPIAKGALHVRTMQLSGESIVVSWQDLLAFEESLAFEAALVSHGVELAAGGLVSVTLSGHGAFAVATHGRPLTLTVSPDHAVSTDPHATLAWSAQLTPTLKTDLSCSTP